MPSKTGLIAAGLVLTLMFASGTVPAATVSGTVTDNQGDALGNASVIMKSPPWIPVGPPDYATFTAPDGSYEFQNVDEGVYRIRAHKPGYGWSGLIIEVTEAASIEINFQLPGSGFQGPPPQTVSVEGWAIVGPPFSNQYFLDEDNDGEPEYHLDFGPPWYDPGSGATRPENGDYIEITGGLVPNPVMLDNIIVYEINGLFWRNPIGPGDESVGEPSAEVDGSTAHIQSCAPNPFNPETTISYQLPASEDVRLAVYNSMGERVTDLVQGYVEAGLHQVTWNASSLSSGIYFLRLDAGGQTSVQKVLLTK